MNQPKQESLVRCAGLAMCALVSAACVPGIVDLGVYEHVPHSGAGHGEPAEDAGAADGAAAEQPPACLATGCVESDSVHSIPGRQCYQVRAQTPDDADEPYQVPTTPGQFVKFTMRAELQGIHYLRSIAPVIDDVRVLHHMKLYEHRGVLPQGVSDDPGTPRGLRSLENWAPGMTNLALDPSIGIELAEGTWFTLEVYYVNPTGLVASDASGFELCATETPPAHLVSFARLGTEHIAGTSASGTCTPQNERPIHLLLAQPQMNRSGRDMRLTLERAGGGQEVVFDRPFDFMYPEHHVLDSVLVRPGDALTTTCSYAQPSQFGPEVDDETCDLYVLHWPARTLSSAANSDVCLQ